jgi:hypothetical protein
MEFSYPSFKHPLMLKLTIKVNQTTPIKIMVKDADRPNTYYMNRWYPVTGVEDLYIRLPKSPQVTIVNITNDKTKNDTGFVLVKKEALPLKTSMSLIDFKDRNIASFINFAQKFAERAGYLSTGEYLSDDAKYKIIYNGVITNQLATRELNTPARINAESGRVEVSKKQFQGYTVPGRFAILLHEFCHVFANKDVTDEIEADLHASQIYLALGYPRIELLNVFGRVFLRADTDLNRKRFDLLKKYIINFDANIQSVKYN